MDSDLSTVDCVLSATSLVGAGFPLSNAGAVRMEKAPNSLAGSILVFTFFSAIVAVITFLFLSSKVGSGDGFLMGFVSNVRVLVVVS